MPKNHSIHDKAQAPPKSTWRVDYVLKTAKSNMASIWICMGFKSLNCFQIKDSYYFFIRGKTVKKLNRLNPTLCVMGFNK